MIAIDQTDKNIYEDGYYDCFGYSKEMVINSTGIKNFENYSDYNKLISKNSTNGRLNFNIYSVVTNITPNQSSNESSTTQDSHAIDGIFIGDDQAEILDFNKWYFFEPQTDAEVVPGDWSMNKNGPAVVYSIAWNTQTQQHELVQLINFQLNNGVASVDLTGVHPEILFQNPHTAKVKFDKKQNVQIETTGVQPDFSEFRIGKPSLETNLTHHDAGTYVWDSEWAADYTQKISYTDSEFKPFDENYPEYGTFTRKYIAGSTMGRWDPTNESALGDTTEFKITIEDTTAPTGALLKSTIEGEKGADPKKLSKSLVSYIEDASTQYGYPIDTVETGTDSPSFEDDSYCYYDTKVSAKDVSGNVGVLGNAEIKVKKNYDGVNEATSQGGFDIGARYSTDGRVNLDGFSTKPGEVDIEFFNISGQKIKDIKYNTTPGSEANNWIGNLTPGTYLYRGTLHTTDGNEEIDKGKFNMH